MLRQLDCGAAIDDGATTCSGATRRVNKNILVNFSIAAFLRFLLRPPQQPAEVAAEACQIWHRSSRFCAAIEASLYDPCVGFKKFHDL